MSFGTTTETAFSKKIQNLLNQYLAVSNCVFSCCEWKGNSDAVRYIINYRNTRDKKLIYEFAISSSGYVSNINNKKNLSNSHLTYIQKTIISNVQSS